jgi:D-glycero-D-manno-heptose 1,7-bisphosphate phosphatase
MTNRAVFFDRDDTLMVNVPYLGDPSKVEVFAEAAQALIELQQAGFLIFVVSNQSGVGRGLITRDQVYAVNLELMRQLGGDYIREFYNSFAAPNDPSAGDRKPAPSLLYLAAEEHDIDLSRSFFVGDRLSDIECGLAAGCRTVFLTHARSSRQKEKDPDDEVARTRAHHLANDLTEAARYIRGVAVGGGLV